jgi:hypothetical protein
VLALGANGVLDPMTGRLIRRLPGTVLEVLDDDRWGNAAVIVREGDSVKVYAPDQRNPPPRMVRPYQRVHSLYLPKVALRSAEEP